MRRIDKMTAEEAVKFFVANLHNCNECKALNFCKINRHDSPCFAVLEQYLKEELPKQKRYKRYDSMEKAYKEFKAMCNRFDACNKCIYHQIAVDIESCFAHWLDEEIEYEKNEK